ncbi:MAG: multidrug resistance protein [Clostridiaceae bacterium]|jgi:uncharacterized membrane protein YfhO|nr:multidrug resistance protein [Clostridiaceae bacterium]
MDLNKKLSDKHYLSIQLVITGIILIATYGFLFFSGKLNIYWDIGGDTYASYWPSYAFFSDYIRNPPYGGWSFKMGLGGNIFAYSSFLLDPFNLIVLLFPKSTIEYGILLAAIAKFFTVSILAHLFLKQIGFRGIPLVIGSLIYTFSGYMVGWGQHYQFATMFCLFTFVLYAFERWMFTAKWILLTLATALLIGCNIYFSYMIFLFLILYYIIRYCILNTFNFKEFLFHGMKTALILFIGVALAAILVLPQVYVILQSPRVTGRMIPCLQFAPISEYITIVCRFLSNNILGIQYFSGKASVNTNFYEAPFLYCGIISFFVIPRLFSKRNFKKVYLVVTGLVIFALLFPSFTNLVFNAFSAYTYRWTFLLIPIISISVAKGLTISLSEEKSFKNINIFISHFIFFVGIGIIIFKNRIFATNDQFIIVILSVAVLLLSTMAYLLLFNIGGLNKKKTVISTLLVLVVMFDISANAFISTNLRISVKQSDKNTIVSYFDSTNDAVRYLKENDKDFYRINKTYYQEVLSDALFQGFYGEKQYNSMTAKSIWDLIHKMDLGHPSLIRGFYDKYDLRNLTSVKYMLSKESTNLDGYKFVSKQGDVYIYENLNSLPLAFTYNSFIRQATFDNLDLYQKQKTMYNSFLLPENSSYIPSDEMYEVKEFKDIQTNQLEIKKPYYHDITEIVNDFPSVLKYTANSVDPQIYIRLDKVNTNSMTLKFTAKSPLASNGKIYLKINGKEYNEVDCVPFVVIQGEKTYIINITSLDVQEIRLDLSESPGEYEITNVSLFEQDNTQFTEQIERIKNSALNIEQFSDNYISGNISVTSDKMLYFSIPYDKGWTALVDNKDVQLHNINIAFMGLPIDAGEHKIELKYNPPGFSIGLYITIITIIILGLYFTISWAFIKTNERNKKC